MVNINKESSKLFVNMVKELRNTGYKVDVKLDENLGTRYGLISGNGVRGIFGEEHDANHLYANYYENNRITVDNDNVFERNSKCPICVNLPKSEEDLKLLLDELDFLGSDLGELLSNNFDYTKQESYLDIETHQRYIDYLKSESKLTYKDYISMDNDNIYESLRNEVVRTRGLK